MAKVSEQEFKKELSSGQWAPLYWIDGEEKYLVRSWTQKLCDKITGPHPSEFNFTRLNADSEPEEIFMACEQLPVGAEYKCVLLTDYRFDALSDGDIKLLTEFFSDISPSTVLVISMPTLSPDPKKTDKKGGKTQKLRAAAEKLGTVLELNKMGDMVLEKLLVSWAEKQGCAMTRLNASKLMSLCGKELTALRNEMDKLCAYADGQEITEEMIRRLAVKNTEVRIFALSDCVAAGDYNGAYQQLHDLFEQNEKPEMILSVLSSVYIDMYRAKIAAESGKTVQQAAADFGYGRREFLLKNASSRASRYSVQTLRQILELILHTDIKLKSSPADRRILLETLLGELLLQTRAL